MKTKFLLLIVLLLQTVLALAIKVEGTVLDEMKQPVIGATDMLCKMFIPATFFIRRMVSCNKQVRIHCIK